MGNEWAGVRNCCRQVNGHIEQGLHVSFTNALLDAVEETQLPFWLPL
jgi:hypothetical protein